MSWLRHIILDIDSQYQKIDRTDRAMRYQLSRESFHVTRTARVIHLVWQNGLRRFHVGVTVSFFCRLRVHIKYASYQLIVAGG